MGPVHIPKNNKKSSEKVYLVEYISVKENRHVLALVAGKVENTC